MAAWSKPQVDREPETSTGRERCDVDVPRNRLVAEVAHFRIEPGERRDREEVAGAGAQADVTRPAPEAGHR